MLTYGESIWQEVEGNDSEIARIEKFSNTFSKKIVSSKRIGDVRFLRFEMFEKLLKSPEDFLNQLAIAERIVKVNNFLCTNSLPEIVDVYYEESKPDGSLKVYIIKEFVKGVNGTVNLLECIKSGIFLKNSFKRADTYNSYINIKGSSITSNEKIKFRRVIGGLVMRIINFEEFLYNKGFVHLGLHPSHIIFELDNIPKFVGERYLFRHKNGFLSDYSALDQKYGSIIIPRYTSPRFIEHINTSGGTKLWALGEISYQIGVLLFDILTLGRYSSEEFNHEIVQNSKLNVSDKFEGTLKEIIIQLTNHSKEEFDSFEEIVEILYTVM